LAEVRESTALQDCYAIADGLIDKAQKALESLPEGQARSCLGEMARYVLERRK
jgi:geranylgeranyl pyrophosphate synthase